MPNLQSFIAGAAAATLCFVFVSQQKREGYSDTPVLPGQKWKVHDPERPYPREVTVGQTNAEPPSDAVVLLDGKDLSHWLQNDPGDDLSKAKPAKWKLVDGCMEIAPGTGPVFSKEKFGDVQLHIEWREDPAVKGNGQGRGNSGVFLMNSFEIQVLDSYKSATYADGQAASMYGQWAPLVNPIRKPGEWQTYDIIFETPKFEDGKLKSPAYVTVMFNGVVVHHRQPFIGPSTHRTINQYYPMGPEGRISLQDHGDKLRFRNIWARRLTGYDQP